MRRREFLAAFCQCPEERGQPRSPVAQPRPYSRRLPLVLKSSEITVKFGPLRVVGPAE
jgi:hypothetical protein